MISRLNIKSVCAGVCVCVVCVKTVTVSQQYSMRQIICVKGFRLGLEITNPSKEKAPSFVNKDRVHAAHGVNCGETT